MNKQFRARFCVNSRSSRTMPFRFSYALALLTIAACVGCARRGEASVACPAIEVRAGADAQSDSGGRAAPLVTTADLTSATASRANGQWVLDVDVTDAAAKRLQAFSKENVGRRLTLVVDGKIRGTPEIAGPLTGKGIVIEGFGQADAQQAASAITQGCNR